MLAERRYSPDLFSQGTSVMPASQLDSVGNNHFCVLLQPYLYLLLQDNPVLKTSQVKGKFLLMVVFWGILHVFHPTWKLDHND